MGHSRPTVCGRRSDPMLHGNAYYRSLSPNLFPDPHRDDWAPIAACADGHCHLLSCGIYHTRWLDHDARADLERQLADLPADELDDDQALNAYADNRSLPNLLRLVRHGLAFFPWPDHPKIHVTIDAGDRLAELRRTTLF